VKHMLNTVSKDGLTALTLTEQVLLLIVFALGALIRNDAKAEVFYKHSQALAIEIFSETCSESAAFALLTCLYQQTTGRIEAAWTTFGIAVRIAQALGC
jgi:Fungal specific transcription factor domain